MAGKGGGDEVPYDIVRRNRIEHNNELLKKLSLRPIPLSTNVLEKLPLSTNVPEKQNKKRKRITLDETDVDGLEDPNYAMDDEDERNGDYDDYGNDYDDVGDGGNDDVEVYHPVPNIRSPKKKKGRGPTRMLSIWEGNKGVKIHVKVNRYGQPCGVTTCNFTNFIANLVKGGHLTLKRSDWRLVEGKHRIWDNVTKFFDINPICEDWVLRSAGKKWRDFKSTLKKTYYDENLSMEENIANGCKGRIPDDEWEWLVEHWSKEESNDAIERRLVEDENLRLKSIDDGDDLYGEIYPDERKGRVCGLGLLGGCKSVTIAKAVTALKNVEEENAQLKTEFAAYRDKSEQRYQELRSLLLNRQGSLQGSIRTGQQNGREPIQNNLQVDGMEDEQPQESCSESRINNIVPAKVHNVQEKEKVPQEKVPHKEKVSHEKVPQKEKFPQKEKVSHEKVPQKEKVSQMKVQVPRKENLPQKQKVLPRTQSFGGGKEVSLCSIGGSKIVAHGRLHRTDATFICIDGLPLGEYYEVLVDVVLDNNVILPRPQHRVMKLGSAIGLCIPWPLHNVMERDGSLLNLTKQSLDFRKRT